ncbi:MAG: tRNA (adenosine(37)-N6)-threonylcarbamoyltransferase complex transferase subunit TsaD [Candidatus Pacebacteria bacterium]|nr:tRNA (adenosine(37)-N6)-threonylcarbamoyltransferase complex transferase subunit TsaD [Candidatus Paceibacterota bacterium]
MKILSIETSCDETAVSILETEGDFPHARYTILGNALLSQVETHREYGGVFPAVAKRKHAKALVPLMQSALREAALLKNGHTDVEEALHIEITKTLEREPNLARILLTFIESHPIPDIDLIAVTNRPGLEPALWVGVNFACALSRAWNKPVVPIDHMEGHILSSVFDGTRLADLSFPALSLLISGGHTEFVLLKGWKTYELIGQTRDDAVGEAFDKVARMLDLPYPGGPEISRLAAHARAENLAPFVELPRPMLDSGDLDLSFSGIKTAVRYAVLDKGLNDDQKAAVAREFEVAVTEVLLKKTKRAIDEHRINSIILGGGVSANGYIRKSFTDYFAQEYPQVTVYLPNPKLSTDNSIMIALAGHAWAHEALSPEEAQKIVVLGNKKNTW